MLFARPTHKTAQSPHSGDACSVLATQAKNHAITSMAKGCFIEGSSSPQTPGMLIPLVKSRTSPRSKKPTFNQRNRANNFSFSIEKKELYFWIK